MLSPVETHSSDDYDPQPRRIRVCEDSEEPCFDLGETSALLAEVSCVAANVGDEGDEDQRRWARCVNRWTEEAAAAVVAAGRWHPGLGFAEDCEQLAADVGAATRHAASADRVFWKRWLLAASDPPLKFNEAWAVHRPQLFRKSKL